jgi:hypothetical protein
MDINDIRDLLPFFVVGTLEPDKKQLVEEALATSEELRADLQLWKRVQQVIAARQSEIEAGHLTSQQIVDRALGALTGNELLSVDNHLRSCPACSEDLMLLDQSLETKQRGPKSWSARISSHITSVRLAYAMPAFAAVAVVCILIFRHSDSPPTSPSAANVAPPVLAENQPPDERTASVWLSYRPELRSAIEDSLPVLALEAKDSLVQVFLSIPRNSVSGIRYKLAVLSRGKKPYHVQELLERSASGDECDSLRVVLSRDALALPGRTTTLAISEILPAKLNSQTPEEYRISFVIRTKH